MIGKAMRMLSLKTIYFNFRYLPFRQAIKLPVWVSRHCRIRKAAGSVRITAPIRMGMIRIGYDGVGIFDNRRSRSIWKNSGEVIFRGRASLGHGARISVEKEGRLIFGDHFTLTAESAIAYAKNISFGDGCLLSWDILIMDTDWHRLKEGDRVTNPPAAVVIGNHVWIGCRTTLLKGTSVADGCMIAAGSVLPGTHIEESHSLVGGVPAKVIKPGVDWEG